MDTVVGQQPLVIHELWLSDGERRSLAHTLTVLIERDGDTYIVQDEQKLALFSTGASVDEALAQYGDAVIDYFDMLRERAAQGNLGKNQVAHLMFLRGLLMSA